TVGLERSTGIEARDVILGPFPAGLEGGDQPPDLCTPPIDVRSARAVALPNRKAAHRVARDRTQLRGACRMRPGWDLARDEIRALYGMRKLVGQETHPVRRVGLIPSAREHDVVSTRVREGLESSCRRCGALVGVDAHPPEVD